MKRTPLIITFLLLISILLSGCIVTQKTTQNQTEIAELKARLARLEERQNNVEQQFQGVSEKSAEAYLAVDNLQHEVATLRGNFEQAGFDSRKYAKESKELKNFVGAQLSVVDKRMKTMEGKLGIKGQKPISTNVPGSLGLTSTSTKQSPEALYKEAYNAFKSGNIEKAKANFRQFLKLYPKHKLASKAQFNLAECFFKQQDYENAILEYDKLTSKYPSSKLVPKAFLYLGFAFLELGSSADARLFFEKVIADYPGTEEAKTAKAKLKMIK